MDQDSTSSGIDAKASIEDMERVFKTGGFDKGMTINALSEMDMYYLSVTDPSGNQTTMLVARSRVSPGVIFFASKPIPLGEETMRLVASRLPLPSPTGKGGVVPVAKVHEGATPQTKQEVLAARKKAQLESLRQRHGENPAPSIVSVHSPRGGEIPQG